MSKVRLINDTNIATAKLREIISFAKPDGNWQAELRVAIGNWHGYAYSRRATVWIKARLPFGKKIKWKAGGGYQGIEVYSLDEALVHLIAHELRHCQRAQCKVRALRPRGGRRTGQAASEADCDLFSLRKLRQWRRRGMQAANTRLTIPRRQSAPALADSLATIAAARAIAAAKERAKLIATRKRLLTRAKRTISALKRIEKRLARLDANFVQLSA